MCGHSTTGGSEVGLYSLGHDGYMTVYARVMGRFSLISRVSTLPITSPGYLCLLGHGQNLCVYVGGFEASVFQVLDLRKGYEVMHLDAGHYKSSHASRLHREHIIPNFTLTRMARQVAGRDLMAVRSQLTKRTYRKSLQLHSPVPYQDASLGVTA